MRRSSLEVYVDVLKVLAHSGPLKITHVMYKTLVNHKVVKQRLEFLVKQDLVEATHVGKISVYRITEKGNATLETLRLLENVLQVSSMVVDV